MPNILVVDDTPVDRAATEAVLASQPGLTVQTASGGAEALQLLNEQAHSIDLVVTDLQMPEIDGLRLVNEIRLNFGGTPVILITAHGSEQLAMQAMECGASSYVPKAELGNSLANTVLHALTISKAERHYDQIAQSLHLAELHFRLVNDTSPFDRLMDLLQQMTGSMKFGDSGDLLQVSMALREALEAAVLFGNLELTPQQSLDFLSGRDTSLVESRLTQEPYASRVVHFVAKLSADETHFTIRHEGQSAAWGGEDAQPDDFNQPGSRAYFLMQTCMDEVQFVGDREVRLVKRIGTPVAN